MDAGMANIGYEARKMKIYFNPIQEICFVSMHNSGFVIVKSTLKDKYANNTSHESYSRQANHSQVIIA